MKITWRRTPETWAIVEARAYYAKMARKGWILEKRGVKWDRYCRTTPSEQKFWIEFTQHRAFDDPEELPEEKQQLFEDAGWELVAQNALVYVFAAEESAEIPLPYDVGDPQQDAMIYTLQKQYRKDFIVSIVTLIITGMLYAMFGFASLKEILTAWWWLVFLMMNLVGSLWDSIYGFIILKRLRRQLKSTQTVSERRHLGIRIPRNVLSFLGVCCLLVGIAEGILSFYGKSDLPRVTDGAYLVASQALDMERVPTEDVFMAGRTAVNQVQKTYALPFFCVYDTYEVLDREKEISVWQDTYHLSFPRMAERFALGLIADGTFASPEAYVSVQIEGADAAWYVPGGMEYVAVFGEKVVYATVIMNRQQDDILLTLLEKTAALWSE